MAQMRARNERGEVAAKQGTSRARCPAGLGLVIPVVPPRQYCATARARHGDYLAAARGCGQIAAWPAGMPLVALSLVAAIARPSRSDSPERCNAKLKGHSW